ncbi:hypothetical protein DFS33DRAFT_963821 [Desarmillaria ectypa]|nr:hypothetical protein DFS33DRAFT_963821 [Desarmillaria ectypa]
MLAMTLSMFFFFLLGVQLQTYVTALYPSTLPWSRAPHFAGRQTPQLCQTLTPCSNIMACIVPPIGLECCTSDIENDYLTCIECLYNTNTMDYAPFQEIIDQWVADCSIQGIALPKLTFPRQDENRTLSTLTVAPSTPSAASGTSSGSSTSISHSKISETSVITAATSQTSTSTSNIARSTLIPVSSVFVSGSSSATALSGTARSAVAMESGMFWIVPALATFLFSLA